MTILRGKIAAVSYLNTVPFVYGIRHASNLRASLLLSPPNQCVTNFSSGLADLALIPIEAIRTLGARIVGSYCLGAVGDVRTVVLMGNCPVEQIETIYTDSHSVTSARLAKVLCREKWDITPRFLPLDDCSLVRRAAAGEAFLLIGDKVFDYEGSTLYSVDLAREWREMTGLPFVFAAWVAREGVSDEAVAALDQAISYGVAHIPEAIAASEHADKPYAPDYLNHNINYTLDNPKKEALALFWEKSLHINPG